MPSHRTQPTMVSPQLPQPGMVVRSQKWSYTVGDQLGRGAFGSVFACTGPFDEHFALKVYHPGDRPYDTARDEWLKEASRLYSLRHPNIVYVHDYFEFGGLFYMVLERCDHSLEDMIGPPMTDRLVVDLARQMLFVMQYLHDNEVVHNDLHGGNFLIIQGDRLTVKLSDFGIAHELYGRSGVRPRVVQHRIMAPEVVAGGYSTKQSDLYQLGLLMFAMYTGEYAIDPSGGYEGIVDQIRTGLPRRKAESLGTPLGNIISVLLRRTADYRYGTPSQVWEDLRRLWEPPVHRAWADARGNTERPPVSRTQPPDAEPVRETQPPDPPDRTTQPPDAPPNTHRTEPPPPTED